MAEEKKRPEAALHDSLPVIRNDAVVKQKEGATAPQKGDGYIALRELLAKSFTPEEIAEVDGAYALARQSHEGQHRYSGEPYIIHPICVARILAEMGMDKESVIAALLHDVVEDTDETLADITAKFGKTIAHLVDGVTKLGKVPLSTKEEQQAENIRKMLLAMSQDIRVIIIKLADRLHNMRTLNFKPEQKRRDTALETLEIYAPIAHRLGIRAIKEELEDLAISYLDPVAYHEIEESIQLQGNARREFLEEIKARIQARVDQVVPGARIDGRIKSVHGIYRKMYMQNHNFDEIYDIYAVRIIVDSVIDCYNCLGIIHDMFRPIPGRFKDYISTPKRNGYKSIHTTVMTRDNMRLEIQIRSREMHQASEYGLAAHWAYKQGGVKPDGQAGWIRDLIEILDTANDAEELLEHTRMTLYQDRIFAFTPKGALHQLPKGATPLDFAYAVHTDLGNKTVGSKVNGRLVPLRTILNNGDVVEILTSSTQEPQPAWLSFAISGKARAAIRRHVRHQERDEVIALGRKLYEEITQRLPGKVGKKALASAIKRLKLDDEADLMFAIGQRKYSDEEVMEALMPGSASKNQAEGHAWPRQGAAISIKGLTPGMAITLAECCHPVPGDRIVGLRREGEGIEVHAIDCASLADGIDADWVDLSWSDRTDGGTARLEVVLHNTPGTLGEMAGVIGANKANILNVSLVNREGSFHTFHVDVEVHDVQHLMRILSALRASDAVAQAERL